MNQDLAALKRMGVVNFTPDSFSDGGKHLDHKTLQETLRSFLQFNDLIFDFGFESTAPMNKGISSKDEMKRFLLFLESIESFNFDHSWISLDTTKLENFQTYYQVLRDRFPSSRIMLNDVSGVMCEELASVLRKFQKDKYFYYIYSATHIPDRSQVHLHPNFLSSKNILEELEKKFREAHAWFGQFIHLKSRILFDPAFGFSKSFEQNWTLINHFDSLLENLSDLKNDYGWLLGISKKSFLKKRLQELSLPSDHLEIFHNQLIFELKKKSSVPLIFRVHDPFLSALN